MLPMAALEYVRSYLAMAFSAHNCILLNDLIIISNELERTLNEGVVPQVCALSWRLAGEAEGNIKKTTELSVLWLTCKLASLECEIEVLPL
jgi:hypothetical protein